MDVNSYLDRVPLLHKELAKRVLVDKEPGYAAKVKLKCLDCVGFEDARTRISQCSNSLCALWDKRPYRYMVDDQNDL